MTRLAVVLFTAALLLAKPSAAEEYSDSSPLRGGSVAPTFASNSDKLKECLSHLDTASCASAATCEWCEVRDDAGLCMPSMYAEMAQCSKWQDMDTSCILSAVDGDDPRSNCEAAKDQQGVECTWCHGFGAGICLDQVQVESAEKILRCGNGEDDVVYATERGMAV